ncbi:MAG: TonB-dependent receptor [Microscillaceae bacterium]|jgi:TonB-dependent receptor|nr:TonB-dependent receptor [Microscillaceae bacterium]
MNKFLFIFCFFLFLLPISVFAQTGTIQGQIIDTTANEGVIGANVVIKGTTIGSSTDIEGKYLIPNVVAGTYTIVVSSIGYRAKEIEGVVVQAGKAITLNVKLSEDAKQLEDVVVQAERETYSEISVISEIKLSPVVAVGVSGEQISKTQDSDGAAVLRRLPGISLFDERFIMVRGLGERYNAVLLNGALTPSTEVDVKSFSFDVIPSSVIDRMLVLKSGAPHLPGEYAGGIIQVFTKNAPDENFTNLSISGGYRVGTTFNEMLKYEGGKTDWLGFDDGTRQLPSNFPNSIVTASATERTDATRLLSSTWLPQSFNAAPDFKIALGLGRRFKVGNVRVGNLTSISYGNSRQFLNIQRNRYLKFDSNTQTITGDFFNYQDAQSNQTVRIGAIHNWSFAINKDHKIEFRNLFNQLGSTQSVFRQGIDSQNGNAEVNNYSLYYENRTIYSGQLAGKHTLGKSIIDWLGGYSYTNRQEPDFRRFKSTRPNGSTEPFKVPVPFGTSLNENGRFFSNLKENVYTGMVNFEHDFGNDSKEIKFKAGVYAERKIRNFNARIFTLANPTSNSEFANVTTDIMFNPANISPTIYNLVEGTVPRDAYDANNTLLAGYASLSLPISEKFSTTFGVRVEHNEQRLRSNATDVITGRPVRVANIITSILPSLNLAYNLSDKMLLRAAYTSSVNRPEFREIAPFLYYDFNQEFLVQGNPNLKTPKIYNVDLRWEYYPTPAEVIMIGGFYKKFIDPIEFNVIGAGNSRPTVVYVNAEFADSYGLEMEVRKSLGTVIPNGFFEKVSMVFNASYIFNEIQLPSTVTTQRANRPMMNQSPYLINTGFYYDNEDNNFQVSLLYNVFGRRIFYVGDLITDPNDPNAGNFPDAYEMPRNTIDLSITKGIGKKMEFKFGINDLLNARYRFVQDSNRDGKITSIDDDVISYRRGQNISLSFKYDF